MKKSLSKKSFVAYLKKIKNLSPNAFFSVMKKYFSFGFDFTIKSIPIESYKIISDIVWDL